MRSGRPSPVGLAPSPSINFASTARADDDGEGADVRVSWCAVFAAVASPMAAEGEIVVGFSASHGVTLTAQAATFQHCECSFHLGIEGQNCVWSSYSSVIEEGDGSTSPRYATWTDLASTIE
eukprot:17081-Pleurochrysis_carterae.AAC.1